MTLHKGMIEKRAKDELGSLLSWSLEKRVAGASPSPEVWERILAQAERPAVWKSSRFHLGYRAVRAQLVRVNAFIVAQIVSWRWPQNKLEVGSPFRAHAF